MRKRVASKGCCVGVPSNESQRLSAWTCARSGRHRFQAFFVRLGTAIKTAAAIPNTSIDPTAALARRRTVEALTNDIGCLSIGAAASSIVGAWQLFHVKQAQTASPSAPGLETRRRADNRTHPPRRRHIALTGTGKVYVSTTSRCLSRTERSDGERTQLICGC